MANEPNTPRAMGEKLVEQNEPAKASIKQQMATPDANPKAFKDLKPGQGAIQGGQQPGADPTRPEQEPRDVKVGEGAPASAQQAGQGAGVNAHKTPPKTEVSKPATPIKNKRPAQSGGVWQNWVRPIVVLGAICLITSLLLALTNQFTQPKIEENTLVAEDAARRQVLPTADAFEDITPTPLPGNILSVYRAQNETGFVITAYGKGYGGDVPATVGFDMEGNITGVTFLENNETPGLGQRLVTSPAFAQQFAGLSVEVLGDFEVDKISGATLSTGAAATAINAASQYYLVELLGGALSYSIPEGVMESLAPGASSFEELEIEATGTAGAYRGDDGTYIIVGQGTGQYGAVTAVVAIDDNGFILGLWADASDETEGLGDLVPDNRDFMTQFAGRTDEDYNQVDTVANATITSNAIVEAVGYALDALPMAKEAAA